MQGWKPLSVWAVAAAVSVAVNLVALVAGGAAWAERPEPWKATPPLLSHRDVTFILGYIKKEIKAGTAIPEPPRLEPEPVPVASKPEARPVPQPVPPVVVPPRAVVHVPDPAPRKVEPPQVIPSPKPEMDVQDVAATTIDAEAAKAIVAEKDLPEPTLRAEMNADLWVQRAEQKIIANFGILLRREDAIRDLHGTVEILVNYRRDGSVAGMQITRHSNHPILDVIAEQAILRSKFQSFYALMETEYLPRKWRFRF